MHPRQRPGGAVLSVWRYAADILEGREHDPLADADWADWLHAIYPRAFTAPYAPHHHDAWNWWWSIQPRRRPPPFLALWPRGHAKSTVLELGMVRTGAAGLRRYAWYLCATQDRADDHVSNIAAALESPGMEHHYPAMADRAVGKHGNPKGWRRNRLRTAAGFTVDALGLDVAARGARLEEHRPDLLGLDDIDNESDSPRVVDRKIATITRTVLPALTADAAVFLAQNLTHPNAIAHRLTLPAADRRRVDMLGGATISGPFPAVRNLRTDLGDDSLWYVTAGEPTWDGMGLAEAEDAIRLYGLDAFTTESQQQIHEAKGALLAARDFDQARVPHLKVPSLDRIVVGIDPNHTGRSDDAGVVVVGVGVPEGSAVPHSYTLADYSDLSAPSEWRDVAARAYLDFAADAFIVERTGLGEHATLTIKGSPVLDGHTAIVTPVDAELGKKDRARPVARLMRTDRRHHHVGHLPYLQGQWCTWVPGTSPFSPGAVDAEVHAVTDLLIAGAAPPSVYALPG